MDQSTFVVSCDTFVVFSDKTKNSAVIFGKNSDRPRDEVQEVIYVPSTKHEKDSKLKCTYIEIDQQEQTYAVLLSKPSWMWGAEIGSNEHNVAIGNEAIFTLETDKLAVEDMTKNGLLGMDLVRLGLERSKTAAEALEVITSLLEKHGQAGLCVEKNVLDSEYANLTYHNSFLIADCKEAWVLETVGKHWAAEKITSGFRNISNCLTIGKNITKLSDGLKEYALNNGWWDGDEQTFDFSEVFRSKVTPEKRLRFEAGKKLLVNLTEQNQFEIFDMMKILRDEESNICRSKKELFPTQGSQISVLQDQLSSHWFTATPDPKRSVFKPVVFVPNLQLGVHCSKPVDSTSWKHLLYSKHERHYDLLISDSGKALNKTLRELERECVLELESKLVPGWRAQEDTLLQLGELFEDAVEAEIRFYK